MDEISLWCEDKDTGTKDLSDHEMTQCGFLWLVKNNRNFIKKEVFRKLLKLITKTNQLIATIFMIFHYFRTFL